MIKTRAIISFLSQINNSVLKSAIISSKVINVLHLLFVFYSSIILYISSILFEYSIKILESFKCFDPLVSHLLIKSLYFALHGYLAYIYIYIYELYQYMVANLLDQIMNLFFLLQNLELWIFYTYSQEFIPNLDYVILCFILWHYQS